LKISNLCDRNNQDFNGDAYDDLFEDMNEQLCKIPSLEHIKVIQSGEQILGAEIGSTFVQFSDKAGAIEAYNSLKGRDYDCRKIKLLYIDEKVYKNEMYVHLK
jgi:hypothetical protein